MTSSNIGLAQRIETYRASKTVLGWCCILSVVATMVIGFSWGGWVTDGTATARAATAADRAQAKLAADICIAQFNRAPEAAGQLAALQKLDTWQRSDFIVKGGWVNFPGIKTAVSGAADLCAQQLVSAKL